jgi:ethanolamine utilization protein EutA
LVHAHPGVTEHGPHDHDHGGGHGHDHAHGHVHDHSHETDPMPDNAVPMEGVEQITVVSAGLDVGSSTSHLSISRLVLRRKGAELSTELVVAERTVLYRSPVTLTPYRSDTLIDADALEEFLDAAYAEAGYARDDIDTGVVIVTGEAANRPNAEQLAQKFAERSGTFICVSAGPHYEALLAAHGSGAAEISRLDRSTVLNIDIGGGTTKLSVITDGVITHTAALSVGARLVAFDGDTRLQRVEPPARWMLDELGSSADLGDVLPADEQERLAELMASTLAALVTGGERSALLQRLWVTEPLDPDALTDVSAIVFSGGVSEYIHGHEQADFGDLGRHLGRLIRDRLTDRGYWDRVRWSEQGIRATVLGAGEHSMQASGITSYFADDEVLPARGLKVVAAQVATPDGLADALRATAGRFELDGAQPDLVYALVLEAPIDYRLLRRIGEELLSVATAEAPLFVVVDMDVAHALGRIIREELGRTGPLIVLDGLVVGELDYLDIGRPLGPGVTVPVTVKSLTFVTR